MNFEIAPKSSELRMTWDDATSYCSELDIDGQVGWRLPTKDELNEIFESDNDYADSYYWTSTENDGCVWVQGFANGTQGVNGKCGNYYVRAVRPIT